MKIKPDYKVFSFRRVPFFIDDADGPRARPWAKIAVVLVFVIVFIYIAAYKL
jgi:hypothetical protein